MPHLQHRELKWVAVNVGFSTRAGLKMGPSNFREMPGCSLGYPDIRGTASLSRTPLSRSSVLWLLASGNISRVRDRHTAHTQTQSAHWISRAHSRNLDITESLFGLFSGTGSDHNGANSPMLRTIFSSIANLAVVDNLPPHNCYASSYYTWSFICRSLR